MTDLGSKNLNERVKFVEDILTASNEGSEDDQEIVEEVTTEQSNADNMPTNLSTPVSLRQGEATEKKKKKKKKKSKTANLPEAGTELKDDYQEKYTEDPVDDPFDPALSISERVGNALWKYRKNHKFSEEKKAIFDNYLRFGGIETGPNAFQGRSTSADTPNDPDAEQDFEAAKISTDQVPDIEEEDMDMVVDFTEVVQVYLGNTFVRQSRFIALQDFNDAPLLIDAFLRYLQIRNVCPEYSEDIEKARLICAQAKVELPKCKRVSNLLPGNFNKACSMLFEGELKAAASMDMSWAVGNSKTQGLIDDFLADSVGMSSVEARAHVHPFIKNISKAHVVDRRYQILVKIKSIAPIPEEAKDEDFISVILQDYDNENDIFEVKLENSIVKELLTNMVMTATLLKLDCGQWYLDRASLVMPTFYMKDEYADTDEYE
ncbi:Argonaute siRNA chaperone complex subunit Arb1-domain-containing protein [Phycomyces blakesleeanus]|uniref:Argonaute siRNA chaperone complex subunit Arb1-domain-containing protein n=1 Tax=Phycomyces blakesleeanus TaxID=4837 RepID=A0ABR3AJD7_PHYBL